MKDSDNRPELNQVGYSAATLPPSTARRSAPLIVLPVWAALSIMGLLAIVLLVSITFGTVHFIQSRQQAQVASMLASTPAVIAQSLPATSQPTLVPTETPSPLEGVRFDDGLGLSDTWPEAVLQWSNEINQAAEAYQFDPNLLAAIIEMESDGNPDGVSYAGAVGLMGIMPQGSGAGLDQRPTSYALLDPATNIEWGAKILSGYLEEVQGDLHYALSVYNGGWLYSHTATPQTYAANVLDAYARAILTRSGVTVDADRWTIAVRLDEEYWAEPLIETEALNNGWPLYAKHTVFDGEQPIIAYAAPLSYE
ncbi:MAG: lytic transglycosylase domain-containing protein [Candidatus Promineifilaceae bacterium]